MTNQHQATPDDWAQQWDWANRSVFSDSSCIIELRGRIEALEIAQYTHVTGLSDADIKAAELEWARTAPGMRFDDLRLLAGVHGRPVPGTHVTGPSADESMALAQRLVRDIGNASDTMEGSFEMNGRSYIYKAYSELTPEPPAPQFRAKHLFTPSNILFDSFCYDPSDSNSVWFGAIITDLPALGDNIKITHRWGEMPSSEVHSTIDYRIVSISENPDYDKRVCTVYATRVDSSDSAPAAAAPAGSLVDRIATDAELCQVYNDAPEHGFGPALRAVYDLGRRHGAVPIRSAPESPLVERVADAIAAQATSAGIVNDRPARAAIREVAAWLREQDGVGLLAATVLTREAN
jgi:hypothetical protein